MTLTYAKVTDLNRLETTATLINGSTVRRISGLLMTISDGYLRHSSAPSAGAKHDGCIGYEKKLLSFLGPSVGFSLPAASCVRASLGTSQATNFRGKNSEHRSTCKAQSFRSHSLCRSVATERVEIHPLRLHRASNPRAVALQANWHSLLVQRSAAVASVTDYQLKPSAGFDLNEREMSHRSREPYGAAA